MGVALGLCMSIVSYSLQVVHVCQYICTYPKIDQVNLWCLLQHNVSCGRSWNHQADKHGCLCVHMYMCKTLVCKYIYTLCIYIFTYLHTNGPKEWNLFRSDCNAATTTDILHVAPAHLLQHLMKTQNLESGYQKLLLSTQVIFIWPNFSHYFLLTN